MSEKQCGRHCWHRDGAAYTTAQAVMAPFVCCFCGKKNAMRLGWDVKVEQHGEYMPARPAIPSKDGN